MIKTEDCILKKSDDFYQSIGDGIWLMDNHKWSFVVWNRERKLDKKYLLVHVDYHWDAGYDFYDSPEEEIKFLHAGEDEVFEIVKDENFIRHDSFICPAIAKGIIDEVHFFCLQGDRDGDVAIHEDILFKFNCIQVLHDSSGSLKKLDTDKPILFDFCVDVFNRSNMHYGSDIWSDYEVNALLQDCRRLVVSAEIVTISMSYGYSGSVADTKNLTKKVIELFSLWRKNS